MTDEEVFGAPAAPAPPSLGSLDEAPISGIPSAGKLSAIRATDPNSALNIAQRAVTNRLTAIPDFGVALANLGSKYGVFPETKLPYLGSMANRALGGQDMPADAPWYQRVGEGLLSAAPTSLASAPRTLATAGLGIAGAEGGAALGQATGMDPELLAIMGGGLASNARNIGTNVGRGTIATLYGGSGKPNAAALYDAAERTGTQPTGAMLGNQGVQRLEQVLERRPGSGPSIMAARQQARNQFTDAAREVPTAAGATMQTPAEIGRATQQTAGAALTNLENRVSNRQQQLQNQMQGGQAPINVADLDRTMSRIVGPDPSQSNLSPRFADPIAARLAELRSMYPQVPEGQQGPPAPMVRQAPFVTWRNDLLTRREGEPPIAQNASIPITQEARGAYRDAAVREGVPPGQFDATQMLTRQLNDQYRPTLEPLSVRAQTDYETAYNRGPASWDINPQAQQDFRTSVNAGQGVTAGDPAVNNLAASRFNDLLNKTLLRRQESALGPINFADALRDKFDPQTVQQSVGPQGAQTLQDVADLARAFHRPTVSGGGTRSIMDVASSVANGLILPALSGIATHTLGAGPGTTASVATAAGALSRAFGNPIDRVRAAMLNSPAAANAMAGRPTAYDYGAPDVNDIRTILQAMQGSTPQGPPLPLQQPPLVAPPVSQ